MKILLASALIGTIALLTSTESAHAKTRLNFDIVIGVPGAGYPMPPQPMPWPSEPDYGYQNRYIGAQSLGETRLNFGEDFDQVWVNSCERGMLIDAVKLRVRRNSANIDYVAITTDRGQRIRLNVRNYFREGSESRWIPLNGMRCVESFQVYGETMGPGPQARVRLVGNAFQY